MLVHPFVARAQQPARLGYLSLGTAMTAPALRAAVIQGLRDLGHVEGQSFVVEYRFAEGKPDRLGDLATELVRLKLALVFAEGTQPTAALKQATATVPTVMFACDAVTSGLVASAKAAKALGLAIPQSLVLRADQVVE